METRTVGSRKLIPVTVMPFMQKSSGLLYDSLLVWANVNRESKINASVVLQIF